MKKSKSIVLVICLLLSTVLFSACTLDESAVVSSYEKSTEQKVKDNQNKLEKARPLPQLGDSLERRNIIQRLELWNNDSKISYIYLLSYGKVMSFHTVKGKISSGNKRLTSKNQQQKSKYYDGGNYEASVNTTEIVEAPSLDGTYGTSDNYVFFWTTEGAYVQWSGEYMLSDQPLKLTAQPILIREIK